MMTETENLKLTNTWDKTFPKSEKVEHRKVTFPNRYGICGWDGMALNTAALDTRVKANINGSAVYDVSRLFPDYMIKICIAGKLPGIHEH